MKTFKIFLMSVILALAQGAAKGQDVSVIQQAIDYTGKEWCIIPLDEDYQEKIYTILSEKKGGSYAKIIVPEYDNEKNTILIIANMDVEEAEKLTITIGDEEYTMRKINKGQTAASDTYFAKSASAIPSNLNMFAKLYFKNMESATLISLNRKFPSILEVHHIKVEIGVSSFVFAPERLVK